MKSRSNRRITIETNRTVIVRQTTVGTQEWDFDYNSTSGAGGEAADRQSSIDSDPRITALKPETHHLNHIRNASGHGLAESGLLEAGLQGTRDGILKLVGVDQITATSPLTPGQSNLNDLLEWLGEDREQAGVRYEEIRRALIKIFVCRGAQISEELADETIDRVARKLPQLRKTYQGRPIDFFCGVAKKIYLEHVRHNVPRVYVSPPQPEVDEEEFNRLERCLDKLTSTDRSLILGYYGGERKQKIDGRKELANSLGIPLNALRIRAHRIRNQLMAMMLAEDKS